MKHTFTAARASETATSVKAFTRLEAAAIRHHFVDDDGYLADAVPLHDAEIDELRKLWSGLLAEHVEGHVLGRTYTQAVGRALAKVEARRDELCPDYIAQLDALVQSVAQ